MITAPHSDLVLRLAAITLAVVPLSMALASRSSPLIVALSSALAFSAVLSGGRARTYLRAWTSGCRSPLGIATLAFAAWTVLSLVWSVDRTFTVSYVVEFWLTLACVLVTATILPPRIRADRGDYRATLLTVFGLLAAACVAVLLQLWSTDLRTALHGRADAFVLNRSAVTALLIALPTLVWLRELGPYPRLVARLTLLALLAALLAVSHSGAALLGGAAAAAAYVLYRFAPGAAHPLAVAALGSAVLLAPAMGWLATHILPEFLDGRSLLAASSLHRIEIWRGFGALVAERPLLGAGFGASEAVAAAYAAQAGSFRSALGVHPHSAALQIWVELGAVGVGLALWTCVAGLGALSRRASQELPLGAAMLAAVASIALISHGAWQGWWAASVGAAAVWFCCVRDGAPADDKGSGGNSQIG